MENILLKLKHLFYRLLGHKFVIGTDIGSGEDKNCSILFRIDHKGVYHVEKEDFK